jgi:hypothetical protein
MYTEFFNPIYGTVAGLPVIAIGAWAATTQVGTVGQATLRWLVIDDDGLIRPIDPGELVADVRFREGRWSDTSPGSSDAEG